MLKILNVGSGPVSTVALPGIDIVSCDKKPFADVEMQDMEELTYPGDSFNIIICVNALDHTPNADIALDEFFRVINTGGYIYIKCWLDQKQTGYRHYWDFKEDGTFTNGNTTYDLSDWGFRVKYTDNGGERRYNFIEAICLA